MCFCASSQGRAGADGARGMPGESGTKVHLTFLIKLNVFNQHLTLLSTKGDLL